MLMQCVSMSNEKDLDEIFPTPKSMYYIILLQINDKTNTRSMHYCFKGSPTTRISC